MSSQNVLLKKDFYEFVNHDWLEKTKIPSDKPAINSFAQLSDEIEKLLISDVKKMADGEIVATTKELKSFVDFYCLVSNESLREETGLTPLVERLENIETLTTLSDWTEQLDKWIRSNYPIPFSIGVSPDMKQSDTYALYLSPTSLILPDTTYYAEDHPNKHQLLEDYKEMMLETFKMIGKSEEEARKIITNCLSFDASLVPFIKSAEESADYTKSYNPRTLPEVAAYHNDIDFSSLLTTLLKQEPESVIITEPVFFEALNTLITEKNFEELKDWMMCVYALSFRNLLTEKYREVTSRFFLALSGAKEIVSKEKQYFYMATAQFDQVIGQYYAADYFGAAAKKDVYEMVERMIEIYQKRLQVNDWLEEKTKEIAILKLNKLGIQVGYPDRLPTIYESFKTISEENGGTLINNVETFDQITRDYYFSLYNQKVDRDEWEMSANIVNAYYHPQKNVIVFPAAILQAPFYDFKQSRSANYGGIGAVIAHEISHAFDNNGAQFDEYGNLHNWWSETDLAHFEKLTQKMIEQFDGIPFGNGVVNGTLTVSENIADAGGLSCALEAAKLEDDYSGTDFFENWARIWRHKAQEQYTDLLLSVDVHAPNKLRANMQVKNLDEFYSIYEITATDSMYLAPKKRISIW